MIYHFWCKFTVPRLSSLWQEFSSIGTFERGSTAVATAEEQLLEHDAILDDIKANLANIK